MVASVDSSYVGRRFIIRPPTTIDDDASPSEDIVNDANRVLAMIQDERHLCAEALLRDVQRRLEDHDTDTILSISPSSSSSTSPNRFRFLRRHTTSSSSKHERKHDDKKENEIAEVKQILDRNRLLLAKLKSKCRLFQNAKRDLDVNDDWTLAQTLFGVTTYYRREEDGSLSIKLEGRLDGVPLFEQVAVLREVDLHHKWAPFVSSSLTVAHLDKLDTVGWFVVGLPNFGLMRDACFRAIGCDCMAEDGSILLVGQGIDDRPEGNKEDEDDTEKNPDSSQMNAVSKSASEAPINFNRYLANDPVLKELDLPEVPQRIGSGRMTIRSFNGIIHVESPTSVRTRLIANIDPNLSFLPQSLLEFVMKKMCGVLLSKLQSAAKRITKDPVRNAHARKMRLERDFYQSWLVPKFEGQCNRQGWTMPPVSAFNLTEEEQKQERAYEEQQRAKKNKKLFHSLDDLDKVDRHGFDDGGSGHSEPQGYGYNASSPESADSDTVSALSMNSSTTMSSAWKNNPIANYLREVEAKTQMRKEEEIRRSRERAAKRLQPKVLDPMKQSRLAELRAAKNRRRILDYSRSSSLSATSSVSSVNDEMKSSSRSDGITSRSLPPSLIVTDLTTSQRQLVTDSRRLDLAIVWTEHGMIMRVLVTSVLIGLLFSALYKETFFGVSTRETLFTLRQNDTGPWYMPIARDAGTIAFMWALAMIHFSFCYVSLMYAFSALQLGDIAGRHAKKFYSQNVHVIVAAASGSMVLLGISKSMLSVIFRILVWRSIWLFGLVKVFASACGNFLWGEDDGLLTDLNEVIMSILDALPLVGRVPSAVMNFVLLPAYHACRYVLDAVILLSCNLYWLVFQSNAVGRLLDRAVAYIFGGVASIFSIWGAFVTDVVDRNEGRLEMHSWREDAFQTTRILLSYSAVFLLTLLLIFNLSAKKARKGGTSYEDLTEKAPVSTPSNAQSDEIEPSVLSPEPDMVDELNDTSNSFLSPSAKSLPPLPRGTPMRRRAPTFDSIAEDEPFFYDAVEHSVNNNGEEEEATPSMSSKNMKRGFRLRRRRRRTGSADDINARIGRNRSYSIS